jgi:hypothetical protein
MQIKADLFLKKKNKCTNEGIKQRNKDNQQVHANI